MHWLWGFSDQIKSWLPGVCAYLQRKCGPSWLHSCWFSFTRAYMYGKGKLKSPLILWVNWALFFESKHFVTPEGSSKEGWGTGSTYCCCLGANGLDGCSCIDGAWPGKPGLGLGRKLRHLQCCSESLITRSVILMGCANSLCCSCLAPNRRLVHHLISCPQCYILHTDNLSTI